MTFRLLVAGVLALSGVNAFDLHSTALAQSEATTDADRSSFYEKYGARHGYEPRNVSDYDYDPYDPYEPKPYYKPAKKHHYHPKKQHKKQKFEDYPQFGEISELSEQIITAVNGGLESASAAGHELLSQTDVALAEAIVFAR